jgi:hypothetical protein
MNFLSVKLKTLIPREKQEHETDHSSAISNIQDKEW